MKELIAKKKIYVIGLEEYICINLYKPEFDKAFSAFRCDFEIISSNEKFKSYNKYAIGEDAIQSIILALRTIGNQLRLFSDDFYNGKLTQWKEEEDSDPFLGFLPLS